MEEAPLQLNIRAKHLLLALLNEKGPVVIADLARQFGVSPRSIRYDLDEIEMWLESTPVRLCRRPRVGIWIDGSEDGVAAARQKLGLVEEYRPVLSPEQRRNIIVARLLQCEEPVTSHCLADELHVSRTTVFADLDGVQAWLERRGLALVRRSNYGLRVVGQESAWRQAVSDLLNEFAESGELGRLLMSVGSEPGSGAGEGTAGDAASSAASGSASGASGGPHLLALLGGIDLGVVETMVREVEGAAGAEFTTGSYSALVFQVAIAVQRLAGGKHVEVPRERLAALRSQPEYSLAALLAGRMSEEFGVRVPEAEIGNLTLHLLGARVRGPARRRTGGPDLRPRLDVESSAVARIFVEGVEKELGIPLSGEETLLDGLVLHLRPTLGRLRFGLPVTNPLLDEITAVYPRIFAACSRACRQCELVAGVTLPPEEVGHLTLHVAAAVLRRRKTVSGRRRVVVASTAGVGVSDILAARLATEFCGLDVVGTSSAHGLREVVKDIRPDFVVSTAPVPEVGVEVVVTRALLPEEDVARLRSFLDRHYRPSEDSLLAEAAAAVVPAASGSSSG